MAIITPLKTKVKQILKNKFVNFFRYCRYYYNIMARPYEVQNIKLFARNIATNIKHERQIAIPESSPTTFLASKSCTQADLESLWAAYWSHKLGIDAEWYYHRKTWELVYVLQALYEHDVLIPESLGLVFGCGQECLPEYLASIGCIITATDAVPTKAILDSWGISNQYSSKKEDLYKNRYLSYELFNKRVTFEHADMNNIPAKYEKKFDFCWSICAFEHLGSIEKGMMFVENSLKTLKPGGIAVHTAEFNVSSNKETITKGDTVLFRQNDFERLLEYLAKQGHMVRKADFTTGTDILDQYIDMPPFGQLIDYYTPHLKLQMESFITTSFGIIIKKGNKD